MEIIGNEISEAETKFLQLANGLSKFQINLGLPKGEQTDFLIS